MTATDHRRGEDTPHTGMSSLRRVLTPLSLVLVLLVLTSACASDDPSGPDDSTFTPANDRLIDDRIFECLASGGFAVTRGPNGEINFVDPEDLQFAGYEAALRQCRQELVAEGLLPAIDEESLREEYRQLRALHDCLLANGFETLPFPSEEVYVEDHDGTNLFALNTEEAWASARELCGTEMAVFDPPAP